MWTVTVQLLLPNFWTVNVWPLLIFLTISKVGELYSTEISLVGKLGHEATSSLRKGEPTSVSKTVKIAHQQTPRLLLSRFWTVIVWPLLKFLIISAVKELWFKWD